MTWLFDSHIHLSDEQYDDEISYIIKTMERIHIKACCVSMDNQNSLKTLDLSKKSNLILPFIGIHPEMADDNLEQMIRLIEKNHSQINGIGEIGLDKTYVNSDDDLQRQKHVFETLVGLAEKYDKPISVHSRKTLDEIYEILPSYSVKRVLLHWFDGNKKQLKQAMDMEFFVSYGPVMVYANDKQSLLAKTQENLMLVETDGPVRFSNCFGLKPAHLSFIPSVVFCASKILRKSYDETAQLLEKNSNRYLGI